MKVISVSDICKDMPEITEPIVMALGNFDGVHKGHQKVISTAVEMAVNHKMASAVMTFTPHPLTVLKPEIEIVRLSSDIQKYRVFEKLGIDYVFEMNFNNQIYSLSPKDFIEKVLSPLHVKQVVAGFDFHFGKNGEGSIKNFESIAEEKILATIIQEHQFLEEKVSSTRIRECIKNGKVEKVIDLLGRPYEIEGTVVNGDKRGRELGFPTANLSLSENYVIPSIGVYAVTVNVKGKTYKGVCNVGYRPTFYQSQERPNIEVHLLDFSEDIYGEIISVQWYKKLRDEVKFTSLEALKEQLNEDIHHSKKVFLEFPIRQA